MTNHKKLTSWIEEWANICSPDAIHWCDGTEEENQMLLDQMVQSGAAVKLNEKKRPGSYCFQSDPSDVARVENRTYIRQAIAYFQKDKCPLLLEDCYLIMLRGAIYPTTMFTKL